MSTTDCAVVPMCRQKYYVWKSIVLLAVLLNCGLAMLMISFNSVWIWLWTLSYACDGFMIANIVVSFFVVYIDDHGIWYTECSIVALKYLRGMFVFDLLSVIPLDYFVDWHRELWRVNRFLGLIRVVKFLSEFRS